MDIHEVGVVGAGQMGRGIAQVFAWAGFQVRLNDLTQAQIENAIASIDADIGKRIARGKATPDEKHAALARITPTLALSDFGDCDLVIETASERESLKREIFASLRPHVNETAILATNTSSISITRLAATTDRPARFIGMHFMNPAPAMNLVELIRGIATDEGVFLLIRELVEKRLAKRVAVAEDFPAFIVNRILLMMINEAVYALYEGVGSVRSIDTALTLGANHPMGPLALADFIGLDTCYAVMNVLHEGLADTKYRPCPLLAKYVEAGWLGRKTGRGFYSYEGETPTPTR